MARSTVTLTDQWQNVSNGICTVTIVNQPGDAIFYINDAQDDDTADKSTPVINEQFAQTENKPTFVKGAGIKILVDTLG